MSAASAKAWRLTHIEQTAAYKAKRRDAVRQAAAYADFNAPRPITLPCVAFLSGEISR